jgi:uncharacterized membrane protein YccC
MSSQDGERSAFHGLIAPGLFLLAGFVVAGIGWVYLAIEPFLIIVFPVSVLLLIVAVIVAVRRKDAMYVNYGDRKEALEIADSLDDEPGPR